MSEIKPLKQWATEWLAITGHNRSQLARKAGLDPAVITRLLNGYYKPGRAALTKLAAVMDAPLDKVAEYQPFIEVTQSYVPALRAWFYAQPLTGKQLAAQLGLSYATLVNLLNGRTKHIQRRTMLALITAGCSLPGVDVVPVGFKRCNKCKEVKEITELNWSSNQTTGAFYSYCKPCASALNSKYYRTNPDYRNRALAASKRSRQRQVLAERLAVDLFYKECYQLNDEEYTKLSTVYNWYTKPIVGPVLSSEATWHTGGLVITADHQARRLSVYIRAFEAVIDVKFNATMPGWLLRDDVEFRCDVPLDKPYIGLENPISNIRPQPYAYPAEDEAYQRLFG